MTFTNDDGSQEVFKGRTGLSFDTSSAMAVKVKHERISTSLSLCHLPILIGPDTPTPAPSKSFSNNYNASWTHPVSQQQHSVPTVYDNTDTPFPPSQRPSSLVTSSLGPPPSTTPLFAVQKQSSLHSAQTSPSGSVW